MPKLPLKPDFLLDPVLAQVSTNTILTDEQIVELVAICEPPAEQLRDGIAIEFERAAMALFSGRTVARNRAERKALRDELYAVQRYAKKLSLKIVNMSPELMLRLNKQPDAANIDNKNRVALTEIENLLAALIGINLPNQRGAKFDDVLVWVVDGLVHAIETRLTPAFNCYGLRRKGQWFSKTRQAKLIFAFLKAVQPGNPNHYNLEYVRYLIKRSNFE